MMPKPSTIYPFVCGICGENRTSTYRQCKWCPDCRVEGKRRREAAKWAAKGSIPFGTELKCANCAVVFAKRFRTHVYCDVCSEISRANKLPAAVEWNRNYQREYQKRRRNESAAAAINSRMSAGIKNSLRDTKNGRSWESLVGFTVADLMVHLERQFLKGMTWANRGEWHIDHVVPLDEHSFDSAEHPEFRAAWALTNLRPLWATDNIKKSNKRTHLI